MSEPREWWINIFSNVVFKEEPGLALKMDREIIHVIEYSAYEAAKQSWKMQYAEQQSRAIELEKSLILAKKQRDKFNVKLKIAVEALEEIVEGDDFYGAAKKALTKIKLDKESISNDKEPWVCPETKVYKGNGI